MAGDWIKMRMDLWDDPAVVQVAAMTGQSEDMIVGKLHRLWCWADRHTTDGQANAITAQWVDRYVQLEGFSAAMTDAGWLAFDAQGVVFPNFARHNGETAKKRCDAASRQRASRIRHANVTKSCDENVTLEKRREELGKYVTRATPTQDEVREAAKRASITQDVADLFWNTVESRPITPDGGWTTREGQPMNMDKWQHALAAYAASVTRNKWQPANGSHKTGAAPGIRNRKDLLSDGTGDW